MLAVPAKEVFMETTKIGVEQAGIIRDLILKFKEKLWEFYTTNGLTELD